MTQVQNSPQHEQKRDVQGVLVEKPNRLTVFFRAAAYLHDAYGNVNSQRGRYVEEESLKSGLEGSVQQDEQKGETTAHECHNG